MRRHNPYVLDYGELFLLARATLQFIQAFKQSDQSEQEQSAIDNIQDATAEIISSTIKK